MYFENKERETERERGYTRSHSVSRSLFERGLPFVYILP